MNVLGSTQENTKVFPFQSKRKITKIDKNRNESAVTISNKIKFIDSARFTTTSLSDIIDNLADRIHKGKYKDCNCFLDYESVKDNLIKYKCLYCNEDYSKKFDEELKERFKNTFKFSNNYINKFILLLKKVFILVSIWMNWKSLMKHHCLKRKNFIAT